MSDFRPAVRILRLLTAIGIFSETSEQRYVATPISKAWTAPPVEGATRHLWVPRL